MTTIVTFFLPAFLAMAAGKSASANALPIVHDDVVSLRMSWFEEPNIITGMPALCSGVQALSTSAEAPMTTAATLAVISWLAQSTALAGSWLFSQMTSSMG